MRDQRSLLDEIVIYSGCVDPTQPNGTVVYCDQSTNEKLRLRYPAGGNKKGKGYSQLSCSLIENTLIILHNNSIIDIVNFNDTEIFHLKRVLVGHTSWYTSFFLDINSSIVYLFTKKRYRKRLPSGHCKANTRVQVSSLGFSGDSILNVLDEKVDGESLQSIVHIGKSFFMMLCSSTRHHPVLKTFNVTQSGMNVLKTIDLSTFDIVVRSRFNRDKSMCKVNYFNQVIACTIVRESAGQRYGVWSYNTKTGERKILYRGSENEEIRRFDFNWDLSEIAVWWTTTGHEEKNFKIVKLLNQDISLKHFARLTCLRSFGEKYLNEHLPVCLRKYLGILKE